MTTLLTAQEVVDMPVIPADHRIPYGSDPSQFGDLYLPPQPGPHSVVVLIHGGCWKAQYHLTHLSHFARALANEGQAVWSLEYRRLGNGGGWPGTFEDVSTGVDHLRQIARPHALDLSRVVVAGHSAGGHLALWLAARHRLPPDSALHMTDPLPLLGIVSLAGVADLKQAVRRDICNGTPQELMGGLPDEVPARYQQGSPRELLPLGIPQVLISGALDQSVPADHAERYAEAATQLGDEVRLEILPNAGHFEIVVPTCPEWIVVKKAILALINQD